MSISTTLTKSEGMSLSGESSGSSSTSVLQTFTVETSLTTAIRGESAYESWLKVPGNEGKTLEDFFFENGGAPKIAMGNVVQGSVASASFREVDGEYLLDLTLPKGSNGVSPTLVIGSVIESTSVSASITGTFPNYQLNLAIPRGNPGRDGLDGTNGTDGDDGVTPTISMGTVETTTGSAEATLVTVSPNVYRLNLKIPRGTDGQDGDDGQDAVTPNIAIGDVVMGDVAGATISGTYPNLFINLTLVKGDKGDIGNPGTDGEDGTDGVSPNLTIGSVTSTSGTPSATITGTFPDLKLNLILQKGLDGSKGNDGVSPNLTIGTVQGGTSASATISGTFPDLKLNLTLPKGTDGSNGSDAPAGISNWFREKIQNITPQASNTVLISNGGFIRATATGTHTWTFDTTGLASGYATSWTMKITNGGVGTQTFTNVIWAGGTKPTLTSSGKDILVFVYDGSDIIGSLGGVDFK